MVHIVDLSMFSAERLAHPVGLADALRHLELLLVVSNTDGAVAQIVRELLSVPNLFGFLISVWPNSKRLVELLRQGSIVQDIPYFVLYSSRPPLY
ncbi:hypothetical protein M404DRAFT_23758 [Pisolithus tinctorius Marx 270]|uniref:Uncharacterized protein n=1 Tax=Pisolithus tinctorius Marx 270 TaxID=870435 RepID=A0A0C3PH17_PISTI|nr:hypothetical protein M404DRAFT_23758 [Pisolithus tinctorius Marx 270]